VVIGAGVNLGMDAEHLPTAWSTSLLVAGAGDVGTDAVLAPYLRELGQLSRQLAGAGGDAVRRVRDAVSQECDTLGRDVRVELPSGEVLTGRAEDIDETGRLVVRGKGGTSALAAGDVTHLRY
jgi:BirA family biotin operon repressor/biotin-[acetyl-CoA-carboxylase] ligase